MQPKPVEASEPERERERDYSTRIQNAVSQSIFSIGDLFRDGQKGVRFPKDLIKVLEQKLQDIAMGRDPAYVSCLLWGQGLARMGTTHYTATAPSPPCAAERLA